jgi:hypothetical protein
MLWIRLSLLSMIGLNRGRAHSIAGRLRTSQRLKLSAGYVVATFIVLAATIWAIGWAVIELWVVPVAVGYIYACWVLTWVASGLDD